MIRGYPDVGTYALVDPEINGLLCEGASLGEIERELDRIARQRPAAQQ